MHRRDLGLTQKEYATRLDVSVKTVQNWELGHVSPGLRNASKMGQNRQLSGKLLLNDFPSCLRVARFRLGLSQAETAERIGVSQDTLKGWEGGDHEPWARNRAAAEQLIKSALNEDEGMAMRLRTLRKLLGLTQREAVQNPGM
jgi:transcriptional regulator with XRE-family HTH domain